MLKTETVRPSFIGSEIEVGGVGMTPVPPPPVATPLHIDYGLLVWGSAIPSNLKPIKKNVQKAVRKILFKNREQRNEP